MAKKKSSSSSSANGTSASTDGTNAAAAADDRLHARLRQLERENVTLKVEAEFCKERLKASEEGRNSFAKNTKRLQKELETTVADADDVLEHTQRELRTNAALVKKYETDIRSLRDALKDSERQVQQLKEEQALSLIKGEHLVKVTEAKESLRETVCQQDSVIAKQGEELKRVYAQLENIELRHRALREENVHLRYRASTSTSLRVFFRKPWLITRSKYKCIGADVHANSAGGGAGGGGGGGQAAAAAAGAIGNGGVETGSALRNGSSIGAIAHDSGNDATSTDAGAGGSSSVAGVSYVSHMIPQDCDDSSLVQLGPKQIVYFGSGTNSVHGHAGGPRLSGGSSGSGGGSGMGVSSDESQNVYILNLDDCTWTCSSTVGFANQVSLRRGHSSTSITKCKLALIGGTRVLTGSAARRPQNTVLTLNTDTMRWQEHKPRSSSSGFLPREGHAATSLREKVYIFGGVLGGMLVNDLCHLDFESMQVTYHSPSTALLPTPRRGSSLSSSELDARRLIVFGGADFDGMALNDVFVFEIDKSAWFKPTIHGAAPRSRHSHAAQAVGRYLIVHGGIASDGSRLMDTWILDTDIWEWECVHNNFGSSHVSVGHHHGSTAAGLSGKSTHAGGAPLKPRGSYSTICNNKLYILHPNFDEKLEEMEVIEFGFPEEILSLMQSKQRNATKLGKEDGGYLRHLDHLHLSDEAVTTLTSIEVSWEPPTKNADRIASYKLMLATNTGAVKEVFHGNVRRYKATNLSPNSEYCFCVKALYEDGSHVWSECKAFVTASSSVTHRAAVSSALRGRSIPAKISSTQRTM